MAVPNGPALFVVGQQVFVPYDDGVHYEGKIQKRETCEVELKDGTLSKMWRYRVHYTGWNKKFDEWVLEYLVKDHNPDVQSEVVAATGRRGNKLPAAPQPQIPPQPSKPSKMQIEIPALLKKHLVDEHDAIKGGRGIPMPRPITVREALRRYVSQPAGKHSNGSSEVDEQLAVGLQSLFDRLLVQVLLYTEEWSTADEVLVDGKKPSEVYGTEHLLRLFVKLPELLPVDSLSDDQYFAMLKHLHSLMHFLQAHQGEFLAPIATYQAL